MPRISPEFAEGFACPHCGRPLRWIGKWRRDFNSPDGWSFERRPFVYYKSRPWSRDAKRVNRIESNGYTGTAEVSYAHQATMECSRCNRDYTPAQVSHVPPPPPESAPAGYYLPDP